MKRPLIVALHIIFWACYLIVIAIMLVVYYRNNPGATDPQFRVVNAFKNIFLFAFVPSMVSFYLYYFILFPKYLQQEKFLLAILYGLLMCAITSLVTYVVHRYLIETGSVLDMDEGGKHGRTTIVRTVMVMTFIGLICGIAALIMRGFITWFNEIKLKAMLKEKNFDMEMALIKSQLDPHLLFNTINNIDSLILKDPVQASNYLNQLSDIMRFMLYETKTEKIPLSREIEYIEKYIALQKIRTANTDFAHFAVTGSIGDKLIAPMIFIPFIENAFKHVNSKKIKNAISIDIFIRAHNTQLICENKFDPKLSIKLADSGLGNDLIEKRLNLIYPGNHTLEIHKEKGLYSVNLTIIDG